MRPPLAPTARGWGLLAVAAVLAIARPVVGLRDLWFPSLVLVSLVVVSIVLAAIIGATSRVAVALVGNDPTPTIGDELTLSASVTHRGVGRRVVELLWLIDGERARDRAVSAPRRAASAGSGFADAADEFPIDEWNSASSGDRLAEGAAVERLVPARRRGPLRVRVTAVRVFDPLGLASWRTRVDAATDVLVLPRPLAGLDARAWAERSLRMPSEPAGVGRPGASGPPEGSLREYRPGDAMRQVHWKQSARQGDLLVNLSAADATAQHDVRLDASSQAYPTSASFERAVSAAVTIGHLALQRGRHVRLTIGADRPHVVTALPALLGALALAETGDDSHRGADDDAARVDGGTVITGRVTPALVARLEHERPGTLVVTASADAGLAPPAWRVVHAGAAG